MKQEISALQDKGWIALIYSDTASDLEKVCFAAVAKIGTNGP